MIHPILETVVRRTPSGAAVLAAAGELDHSSRPVLEQAAVGFLRDGVTRLVLDLSLVTFCDSGGLSLFVDLHRRADAAGGWVRLAGACGGVLTVLMMANFDRLFTLYDTVEAADAG